MASSRLASFFTRISITGLLGLCVVLSGCLDQQPDSMETAVRDWVRDGNFYPYRKDSPYRNVLNDCMSRESAEESCRVGVLPPLGYPDGEAPTVDEVMDRVIVTHDWMGRNFRRMLERMPEDTLYLMRSLTAIMIGSEVRPSYYTSWYAAIAIDPNYLWLTPEQRATINLEPDYRHSFGQDLQFAMPWRYVRDSRRADVWTPVTAEVVEAREMDTIIPGFARLFYHELAHAVDYLFPAIFDTLQANRPIGHSLASPNFFEPATISYYLRPPLESTEMNELARVAFWGEQATEEQNSFRPDDVAGFFEPDKATDWYNYSTDREDLAMMFEEVMMKHHFDIDRHVAVTNRAEAGETTSDLVVTWGQRNRIGDPGIRERMRGPLSAMLPEFPTDELLDGLPEPTPLQAGESWHDNLDPENLSPDEAPTPARRDTRRPSIH